MKILIVDDEADIRRIERLSLERLGGMSVVEASSGAEALDLAAREQPNAILLDVMMPEMDGPTTLKALRQDPSTAWIPVIFLTAEAMPSAVERLQGLGAARVLTKPFEPATLPPLVRDVIEAEADPA